MMFEYMGPRSDHLEVVTIFAIMPPAMMLWGDSGHVCTLECFERRSNTRCCVPIPSRVAGEFPYGCNPNGGRNRHEREQYQTGDLARDGDVRVGGRYVDHERVDFGGR